MKEIYALSIALQDKQGRYLFGLRNPQKVSEYAGRWSMPSTKITKEEYQQTIELRCVPEEVLEKLASECFGLSIKTNVSVIISGVRQREDYRLHLIIGLGEANFDLPERSEKYVMFRFLTIPQALRLMKRQTGACVSLLIQHLINEGKIDPAIEYLELPPLLADSSRPLTSYSPEELWRLASANYAILLEGQSGSDGYLIRQLTVDRYIERYISHLPREDSRILDLGCGSGALVASLHKLGYDVEGLDICPNPLGYRNISNLTIRVGKIEDLHSIYEPETISLVILNLVCQWIENLDLAVNAISQVLRPQGRVLMTVVPPEFSKNGRFVGPPKRGHWLINKPLRRKPFLTMLNRVVGPLWFFPRTTVDYLNAFANAGLYCCRADYLFMDSMLNDQEKISLFKEKPGLKRHNAIPALLVLEFAKLSASHTRKEEYY